MQCLAPGLRHNDGSCMHTLLKMIARCSPTCGSLGTAPPIQYDGAQHAGCPPTPLPILSPGCMVKYCNTGLIPTIGPLVSTYTTTFHTTRDGHHNAA